MTYYEWISNLEKLKTSPIDYNIITDLNTKTIENSQYVIYHFIYHFADMINVRLNKAFETCMNSIFRNLNKDNISLELINLNKEVQYLKDLSDISIISIDDNYSINRKIDSVYDEMKEILRTNIEYVDASGEYIRLFEITMNNKGEE